MIASQHRYSHHALRALSHAATLAEGFQHPYQDTGHLLLGIVLAAGSVGTQALEDVHFDPTVAGVYLKNLIPRVDMTAHPPRSEALEKSLEDSILEANWLTSPYVGTEHLLLGLLAQQTSMGAKLLEGAGITIDKARIALNLTPKTLVINMGAKGYSETAKQTLKMGYHVAQD